MNNQRVGKKLSPHELRQQQAAQQARQDQEAAKQAQREELNQQRLAKRRAELEEIVRVHNEAKKLKKAEMVPAHKALEEKANAEVALIRLKDVMTKTQASVKQLDVAVKRSERSAKFKAFVKSLVVPSFILSAATGAAYALVNKGLVAKAVNFAATNPSLVKAATRFTALPVAGQVAVTAVALVASLYVANKAVRGLAYVVSKAASLIAAGCRKLVGLVKSPRAAQAATPAPQAAKKSSYAEMFMNTRVAKLVAQGAKKVLPSREAKPVVATPAQQEAGQTASVTQVSFLRRAYNAMPAMPSFSLRRSPAKR